MKHWLQNLATLAVYTALFIGAIGVSNAQDYTPARYEIGTINVQELWINPNTGSDANDGSRNSPLRSVQAAFDKIPSYEFIVDRGFRIILTAGMYTETQFPAELSNRWAIRTSPIIIQPETKGSVMINRPFTVTNCNSVYLIDLIFNAPQSATNVLTYRKVKSYGLIRGCTIRGSRAGNQDAISIADANYIYVEDNDVSGARDNALDITGAHFGHVVGNKFNDVGDYSVNIYGGSAYIRVEANEITNAGNGGFTAGSATPFSTMVAPWVHYDVYDIKFFNNIIRDVAGPAFTANGAYNTLFAYNTAYRVGSRNALFEAGFGKRGCDVGNIERCNELLALRGWGNNIPQVGNNHVRIPNRNVFVYNNIFFNPSSYQSPSQHLRVIGAYSGSEQNGSNVTTPTLADEGLMIKGNVIWNGNSMTTLLGSTSDAGCNNPSCNPTQLRADNFINISEPELEDAANSRYYPRPNGNLFSRFRVVAIPDFTNSDRPLEPSTPPGNGINKIERDKDAESRVGASQDVVGALIRARGNTVNVEEGTSITGILNSRGSLVDINSIGANATVDVYDIRGNKVATITSGYIPQGVHTYSLKNLGNGMYVVVYSSGETSVALKVLVTE